MAKKYGPYPAEVKLECVELCLKLAAEDEKAFLHPLAASAAVLYGKLHPGERQPSEKSVWDWWHADDRFPKHRVKDVGRGEGHKRYQEMMDRYDALESELRTSYLRDVQLMLDALTMEEVRDIRDKLQSITVDRRASLVLAAIRAEQAVPH